MYLSLNDTIALALENNIDVEVQRYNFLIADSSLHPVPMPVRAEFSSRPSLVPSTGAIARVLRPTPSTPAVSPSASRTREDAQPWYHTGLLMTGAQLTMGFNNNFSNNNNPNTNFYPSITSGLQLNATRPLPLLKVFGTGFPAAATITIAKINLKLTDAQFRLSLYTTLTNVIQQYWTLVGDRMAVDVAAVHIGPK